MNEENEINNFAFARAELDAEARAWLLHAGADPDAVPGMAASTVRALVNLHYPGGWSAFFADGPELVTP